MSREIVWTVLAEADAQELFGQILSRSEPAAQRLLEALDRASELLSDFPEIASRWHPPIRRFILPEFHSGLFYVVEPRRVVVIGLKDLRRLPESIRAELQGRLPG